MKKKEENLAMHSLGTSKTIECENADRIESKSRTVSFNEESKAEDGDFILFPDHYDHSKKKTKSNWKNQFVTRRNYTILFGAAGCVYSASFRYFNGTITTMEKRFKISSRNTAIISSGNDISQVFASIFITYYAREKHKPQYMSRALFLMSVYCLMSALPHFLYGPGEEALQLTKQFGLQLDINITDSLTLLSEQNLCSNETFGEKCSNKGGEKGPQIILFFAQFLFGMAESVFYVFGLAYLDDNVSSSISPFMISLTYFIKMMGPALGYSIASFCLNFYIDPTLTPLIAPGDSRWLGCWWSGWIFIAGVLLIFGYLMSLFPKKIESTEKSKNAHDEVNLFSENRELASKDAIKSNITTSLDDEFVTTEVIKINDFLSHKDFLNSLKRLLTNKILLFNNLSTVFCLFGSIPYWMFAPKYFEIEYLQTPSEASFKIGTFSFIFSGVGVLLSGIVITRFKPRARNLAAWNILTSTVTVIALITNYYMGCEENDKSIFWGSSDHRSCNVSTICNCDFVKYTPVCGSNNETYISACHAGCTVEQINPQLNIKFYTNCSCIEEPNAVAVLGACKIDCRKSMMGFLTIIYVIKFLSASGLAGNFLLSLRCVAKQDKPLSVGLMLMMTSLFAFIPAPIYFGINIDQACLVWGRTCTSLGNCWHYDGPQVRFAMNIVGAFFVAIGTCLDGGVWYYAKHLKIFEEENTKKIEKQNNKN